MQKKLKKLIILLAILGLIGFFANLAVDNPYTHRLIRLILNEQVTKHTNLTINFQAIKVKVVPAGFDLYGLQVAANSKPDSPFITVSQVRARLSVWSLILGELRLANLELNDPTILWPPPGNLTTLLRGSEDSKDNQSSDQNGGIIWPPAFDIPVSRIALINAKIFVEHPIFQIPFAPKYLAMSIGALDATWEYNSWRDMKLALDLKSLDLSIGAASILEATSISGEINLKDKLLSLRDLKIDGERLHFSGDASGELRTAGDRYPKLKDITFTANTLGTADISLLGSLLDIPDTHGILDGKVKIDATIPVAEGTNSNFQISGEGKSHEARLFGFRLFNTLTSFIIDQDSVRFPNIAIIVDDARVAKGSGEIKLNNDIDFDFRLNPSGLHLVDLLESLNVDSRLVDLTLAGQEVRISGKGDPFVLNGTASIDLTDIIIPSLPPNRSAFPHSPICHADLRMLVTSDQLDFTGTRASCLQYDSRSPMKGTGTEQIDRAKTDLAISGGLQFATPGKTNIRILAPSANLRLAEYFTQIPMAGRGRVETNITGPFDHLSVDTHLAQEDVAIARIPLGTVEGDIKYKDNILSWQNLSAENDDGGFISSRKGSLNISSQDYHLNLEFNAEDLSRQVPRQIATIIDPENDFSASVKSLNGKFSGPLFYPLAGSGSFNFLIKDVRLNGETLASTADGSIIGDQKGWHSQNLVLTQNALSALANINHMRTASFSPGTITDKHNPLQTLGLNAQDKLNISFHTIANKGPLPTSDSGSSAVQDHLSLLPYIGDMIKPLGVKGKIVAQGEFSGTTESLQGSFTGSVDQPEILGSMMTAVNLRGFVRGSHLDLVMNHGGNALDGRLSMELFRDGLPYEWYVSCHRMDLRVLGASLFHDDPRNYLYFTGDWRMKGKFKDFWHSIGELKVTDLRGNYVHDLATQTRTIQIRQDQPVKLLFTETGWRFEGDRDLFLSGKHIQLRVSTKDSRPPERIGLFFESVIDAGIIKTFVQDVDTAEGKINIVGSLFGSASDPRPNIEITDLASNPLIASTWRPLSIGIADIRPSFRNIQLKVNYHDGRLFIDKLSAEKGSGKVNASGTVSLGTNGDEESHLDINLQDATIVYPVAFIKNFESQISGNLVVSGQGMPYKLAGDININRARSTREVDIRSEIINALRQKSIGSAIVSEKPKLTFDLNVTANQSINIHNRNLQTQLSTDLRVKGSDINPILSGQIEVNKGKFTYKQEFKITRGLVIFDDPVKPDPSLDILAVSDVDIYRVYLGISGRASNPSIEFSVDPPTRENGTAISKLEILVLLSRGRLPEESQSMGQQTQSAATSEAANLLLGQFEEPVEKLLDVSGQNVVRNVYIDTHPAPDGSPVPRLNLPFDLGENIDLILRTDQATSQVSLEYNLNESIYASGVHEILRNKDALPAQNTPGNIEGDSRVNMKFRFSFE